jgi:hypothetical protein
METHTLFATCHEIREADGFVVLDGRREMACVGGGVNF